MAAVPEFAAPMPASAPTRRPLQPIGTIMADNNTHPPAVQMNLLCVDDVAEWFRVSRASVLHLVHRRQLPFYRLHSGLRFKSEDIEAFLATCRTNAAPNRTYARTQDPR